MRSPIIGIVNGIHDMGGMDGFGRIETDEPEGAQFHSDWEARAFALTNLVLGRTGANADEFRHAIERIAPARYLASAYYERWILAAETLLVEKGILARSEIDARAGGESAAAVPAASVAAAKPRAKNPRAKFRTGERVRARDINPAGHTRLPRYVRGKIGVIHSDRGVYIFPDTNAHHAGEARQHVYCVAFAASHLFGSSAHARDQIVIDLWEDYLEPGGTKPVRRATAKRAAKKSRAKNRR